MKTNCYIFTYTFATASNSRYTLAHWTTQQDYIVIGVTVNHGQRAGYSERVASAISEGMVPEYRHNPNAVDAKAASVMYVVDSSGLANASRRVLE